MKQALKIASLGLNTHLTTTDSTRQSWTPIETRKQTTRSRTTLSSSNSPNPLLQKATKTKHISQPRDCPPPPPPSPPPLILLFLQVLFLRPNENVLKRRGSLSPQTKRERSESRICRVVWKRSKETKRGGGRGCCS